MVREIRLYIEGGGSEEKTKRPLREGFHQFFRGVVQLAREKGISFRPIACGSREAAFKLFSHAGKDHPGSFNALLVDADHAVSTRRSDHVKSHFHWSWKDFAEDQCHLMVQVMESWFLADRDAVENFYGKEFQSTALPGSKNVETVEKDAVLHALKLATRKTKKGEYHKIRHASELLKLVRPLEVRKASSHCECLFQVLEARLQAVS